MPWPDDRTLPIEVQAALGADVTADPATWSWTDLSSRLVAGQVTIRQQASTGGQGSPGTCTLALLNDDGWLTPLHPMSPYWPHVDLGTPLRVRLRRGEDAFGRSVTSGWTVAESGQAWTSLGGLASNYSVSGGVARHSHTSIPALRRTDLAVSLRDCEQTVDLAPSVAPTGAAMVSGLRFRVSPDGLAYYWLRVEFNPSASTVNLKIGRAVGGSITDIATRLNVPGVTYSGGGYLRMRASVIGSRLAVKVWPTAGIEPAGWQLTIDDEVHEGPGRVGTMSWVLAGNTNALPVDALFKNYALRVERFGGFADQWEPTFVPTGEVGNMSSAVAVTASGVMRRLTQGRDVVRSPMRRTIAASRPLAYYPAEDGIFSTAAGSAVVGQGSLVALGSVNFKDENSIGQGVGTSALVDLSPGGSLFATFDASVAAATQTRWTVHTWGNFDVDISNGDITLMEWLTPGGTFPRWQLVEDKDTLHTQVIAYDNSGSPTVVVDRSGVQGGFRTWAVSAQQVGPVIQVTYWRDSNTFSSVGSVAGTLAGVSALTVNASRTTAFQPMPFGHLAVWATTSIPYQIGGVLDSYGGFVLGPVLSHNGEAAHLRMARLAAEAGIPLSIPTVPAGEQVRMGYQPEGTTLDLLAECAEVDGGLLYERDYGLAYLPRSARYNQPPALTIDLATYRRSANGGGVLTPVYDDQDIRNQWTVERRDGSFAVADDLDSQRRGVYADSVELNLASDSGLLDQATWRLHLTTAVDLREASFPIDLAANPGYIDGWLSCGIGSRVVRTNPPAQYRPGPLNRLALGWTETLGPRSWTVQVTPELAAPWDVATVDGPQRIAADGSTLAAALTATGTTFQLASTAANGVWTTTPTEFPLDLLVGGEQIRVSAITGISSPQTVTVAARGLNGVLRAWPAGTPVDVWEPAIVAL